MAASTVSSASAAIIAASQATAAASAAALGPEAASALDYFSALATKYEKLLQLGGFLVAALTLLWALVGNPNLLGTLRSILKRHLGKTQDQAIDKKDARVLQHVEWQAIASAAADFAARTKISFDLVIGIQPSGTQIAHLLSQRFRSELGHVVKKYHDQVPEPFFVFRGAAPTRSQRKSSSELTIPSLAAPPKNVLIVDAVTTFGNALQAASELVLARFPQASVHYYVYAIDSGRLAAANAEIFERVNHSVEIDNFKVWLQFPWEGSK